MGDDFWTAAVTAIGLLLVIEGLLYALFPAAMQRMMAAALALAPSSLRSAGTVALAVGVGIVWLARA